jgi:hypothetical protein
MNKNKMLIAYLNCAPAYSGFKSYYVEKVQMDETSEYMDDNFM